MGNSSIEGLKEWNNWINSLPEELNKKVKSQVSRTAYIMEAQMKLLAPVDTGHLRRNINVSFDMHSRGASAIVGSGTIDYAIHIEFGTYRRPATPYFYPIVYKYKPKFEKRLLEILKDVGV